MNNIKKCICILLTINFLFFLFNFFINNEEKIEIKKNDKRIAVFIDNKEVTTGIPDKSSNYIFDKYVCSDNSVILDWNNLNWNYYLSNVRGVVSCSLYFIDSPKPYLADSVSVGQFVDYAVPIGKSSASVTCNEGHDNKYSGWRVLSKEGTSLSGTVTLVHAGTPECYYHPQGQGTQSVINLNNLSLSYVNDTIASSGRSIECSDVKTYNVNACSTSYTKILDDLIKTDSIYWLASINGINLWGMNYSGAVGYNNNISFGIRPIIVLKSGIKNTGGQGTNANPFTISN